LPDPFERAPSSEPSSSRGFPRKLAIAAVLLVAAAVLVGRAYLPGGLLARPASEPPPATLPPAGPAALVTGAAPHDAGQIVVKTEPAGARILLDGQPAGESPRTLERVPAGLHVLTFISASGSVKQTVRVVAGRAVTLDVPIFSGWVAVFA